MSTGIDTIKSCAYCGNWHSGMCPRIESIEYHADGTVKVSLRAAFAPAACSCPEAGLDPMCAYHGSFAAGGSTP